MSNICIERLEEFIRSPLENGLTRSEQMEMACRLLAFEKASKEPVAYKKRGMYEAGKWDCVDPEFVKTPDGWHSDYDPLFAAPQLQPVSEPYKLPDEMTPEMMRAVQLHSELGAYAASNLCGAYSLFSEFWSVACRAAMKKS